MAAWDTLLAAADRAAVQHLGGPVRYTPASGPPVDVTGIFDAAYVTAAAGGQVGVGSSGPAVFLVLADLPTDPEDDDPTITVAGKSYRVKGAPEKDGTGGVVLRLRKVTGG